MKVTTTKSDQSQVKMVIELTEEDLKGDLSLEQVQVKAFSEAIREEKIDVLSPPQFKVDSENPRKFAVVFTTRPQIEMPKLDAFEVEKTAVAEPTEEEVDFVMKEIVRQMAKAQPVEREVKEDDLVLVTYEARDEDNKLQMGGEKKRFFMGAGVLLPEFEAALLGAKVGDSKRFKAKFPEDHFKPALRGKELDFSVKILEVYELELPELDDNLAAQMLGEGKTVADLKTAVASDLVSKRKANSMQKRQTDLLEAIVAKTKVDLPDTLVEQELNFMIESMYKAAEAKGVKREDKEAELKAKGHDPQKELRSQAVKNVTLRLALDELLKGDDFQVNNDEAMAILERELANAPEEEKQKLREEVQKNPAITAQLVRQIQMQKLFKLVLG